MSLIDRVERATVQAGKTAALLAAKKAEAVMKRRIFRERQARNGQSLGPYNSRYWIAQRRKRGRQTQEKDLFFLGNLFRSLIVGTTEEERAAFGFSRTRFRKIAEGQEKQTRMVIFRFSRRELNEIMRVYKREFRRALRRELPNTIT